VSGINKLTHLMMHEKSWS